MHGAFHMDTVQVAVTSENSGKRREGTITKIISRGTTRIVCTYEKVRRLDLPCRTILNSVQIFLFRRSVQKGAVSGHKVVVEITDYGKEGRKPEGKVVEIIGHINDPGTDIMSIVKGLRPAGRIFRKDHASGGKCLERSQHRRYGRTHGFQGLADGHDRRGGCEGS